jgi:hypothetical protein
MFLRKGEDGAAVLVVAGAPAVVLAPAPVVTAVLHPA